MKIEELLKLENEKFSREKINRIAGALFGFAIGDAMGATTEFMSENAIKDTYGEIENIVGGGWLNLKAGEVTDDTQMSICVMDAIMKNDVVNFKENVANEFVKWFEKKPKDVGIQCSKAISYYITNNEYIFEDNDALGNGTLMRALPCALLDTNEGKVLNVLQGEITHNNKKCEDIILEYSKIIQNYINDIGFKLEKTELLEPTGYVVNTYNNVKYWSNRESFEEGIIGSVNHGGDADTIAAISGSILGAKFGYEKIPTRWIEQLNDEVKEKLIEFIEFLVL